MLASRPVVATDVGSVSEAIADGETGLLVPPDDPPALVAGRALAARRPRSGGGAGRGGTGSRGRELQRAGDGATATRSCTTRCGAERDARPRRRTVPLATPGRAGGGSRRRSGLAGRAGGRGCEPGAGGRVARRLRSRRCLGAVCRGRGRDRRRHGRRRGSAAVVAGLAGAGDPCLPGAPERGGADLLPPARLPRGPAVRADESRWRRRCAGSGCATGCSSRPGAWHRPREPSRHRSRNASKGSRS